MDPESEFQTAKTELNLNGKVALVTGATRGVGKGIALALAEAGATVYLTGRTVREGDGREGLPGSLESIAAEIEGRGGKAVAMPCDHRHDVQTADVFDRIDREVGRLNILVNNVWGGYEGLVVEGRHTERDPFWSQPVSRWDLMFQAGVRAHFVCSVEAAKRMTAARAGLIVTISYWAAQTFLSGVAYGAAKAADDKMTADMATSSGHSMWPRSPYILASSVPNT